MAKCQLAAKALERAWIASNAFPHKWVRLYFGALGPVAEKRDL
jgi:hypothetical protein